MSRTGKPRPAAADPVAPDGSTPPPVPSVSPAAPVPPVPDAGVQMMAVDARRVMLAGTAAFALAFVLMLPLWNWLGEHQHRVWLWTALAGTVLGLLALPLVSKHSDEGRLG